MLYFTAVMKCRLPQSSSDVTTAVHSAVPSPCLASCSLSTEAYKMLTDANQNGVKFSPAVHDQLIRSLLAEGSLEDALQVQAL